MSKRTRCPFCNSPGRGESFMCGTVKVADSDGYQTGNECDKNCFRNAYIRCLDLLQRVVDEERDICENLQGEIMGELGIGVDVHPLPMEQIKKLYDENEGR